MRAAALAAVLLGGLTNLLSEVMGGWYLGEGT